VGFGAYFNDITQFSSFSGALWRGCCIRAARAGAHALLELFATPNLAHETARRVAAHALSSAVGGTPNRTLELLRSADAEVRRYRQCP
jgi:hypothetical protein